MPFPYNFPFTLGTTGYTDGANQTVTVGGSPNGVRHFSDSANRAVTVSRSSNGVRSFTASANRSVTVSRTVSGTRAIRDGANTSVAFSRSPAGHKTVSDGANRSLGFSTFVGQSSVFFGGANRAITFTPSVGGVRGAVSGANRSLAFGGTLAGSHAVRSGADRVVSWQSPLGVRAGLHGTASTGFSWVTGLVDSGRGLTVTGSWSPHLDGLVSFIPFTAPGFMMMSMRRRGVANKRALKASLIPGAYVNYPDPVATETIVDGVLNAQIGIVSGDYLVVFSEVTLGGRPAQISPFVFQCPPGGVVDLNTVVSSGAQPFLTSVQPLQPAFKGGF